MTYSKRSFAAEVLVVALLWQSGNAQANYHNQSKILARNGDLIVEAPEYRNISLGSTRDNVAVVRRIKHHSVPQIGDKVKKFADLLDTEVMLDEVHLCPPGYTGNGVSCRDINECAFDNGGCNSSPRVRCINTKGSFRCGTCPAGWIGDGRSCEVAPTSSCDSAMICHPLAKCEYIANAPTCTCPDEMFGNGFGPDGCHTAHINNACANDMCMKNRGYLSTSAHGDGKYIIEAPRGMYIKLTADVKILQEDDKVLIYGNATEGRGYLLKNITKDALVEETFNFDIITIFVFHNAHWTNEAHYEFLSSVDACGGNFSESYGRIALPEWPKSSSSNMECVWTISAPLGRQIELVVQNFTLEDDDCGVFLEIRNGMFKESPLIGRYCKNEIPSRISSLANSLYLRFKTNALRENPRFLITWQQTKIGCGVKLTSYKGSIHSPFNPTSIMESVSIMTCAWQIHVVQGSSIAISISSTSMGTFEFCRSNSLKIFDDFSDAKSLLPLNCSQIQKDGLLKLFSTSNVVLVVFNPTQDNNFVLDYETNCHVTLDEIHGVIESPTTSDELNCKWDIRARGRNTVKLAFSHLRLETLHMVCPNDYLVVWDMMNEEVLQKYHLCKIPPPIVSIGNHLVVQFATGLRKGQNSFRAEYSQVGCSEVITNQVGSINSPKYPYSIDVDCEWYFKAPPGMQIILSIKELKIDAFRPDCLADAFTVKESKNSSRFLLKACSSQETETIVTSPANQLYVVFRTGPTRIRKYFKASYKTVDGICGGMLKSSLAGVITSPNYPLNSLQGNLCKWEIVVPKTFGTNLNFTDIQLSQSHNCSESYLKVSELQDKTEVLLKKFCSTDVAQTVYVTGSNVAIEYVISGEQNWGRFSMEFSKRCGGKISQESGYIGSYAGDNCVWWFEVPEGTVIRFNIIGFECYCAGMDQNKKECTNGLGFKETPNIASSSNYSKFYCDEHQSHLTFEGPKLYIFANGINFRAEYSTVGNPIGWFVKSARGTLEWSPIRGVYRPYEYTKWFFDAAIGNMLQFEINELNIANSDHCNEDYLEVIGTSSVLGVYCGNTPPGGILTSHSFVIRLCSSLVGSTTNSFKLKWSYAHLNEISNETDGVIQSPPITMVRSEEESFAWRILVNRNNFIDLHFEQYLEGLELFDGFDDTALPVTIHPSPWRFVSSSNVVYLKTINANLEYFLIRWNLTNPKTINFKPSISTCRSEFFIKSQQDIVVSSPGYPGGYEPNLQCDWILKPFEANEHVVCELYEVMIEETDKCLADFLAISISSDLEQWHEVDKICNSSIKMSKPFKVFHGTPNIKIDFVSDYAINGTGFRAVIKTACGSNLTESFGVIEGDKLRSNETECMWRVSTKPNTRILLQLNFAPTNKSFHDDCQEYALIHDGVDEHAPLLPPGKICNSQNGSEIFLNSTSNFLTIKYKLSPLMGLPTNRWTLKYRAYSLCNPEYRLTAEAPTVNVTLPNYPNVPQTECEWTIVGPVGDTIKVDFIDQFDMKIENCENEFLEMFDGSTSLARSLGRFCQKPPMLKTTQNVLYMRYLTDANESRSGFKARISLNKCGCSFSDMDGILISPGYAQPGGYAFSTDCDYVISLPMGTTTQLVVQDVHLPFDAVRPKSKDYLEVIPFDEEYGHEQQHLFIYGNTTKGKTYHFNANKVVVRFHSFFTNLEFRGFRIEYHGFDGRCKQIATSNAGYLTMGMVKARHREEHVDTNCEWKIVVPKGRRVHLKFLNLNDYNGQNLTDYPRISVFSDPECACKILEFDINSYDTNSTIQSSDNIMIVRMYMPHVEHRIDIIKAHYTSDEVSPCPAKIDSDNASGAIDIIDTRSIFNRPYYCDIPIRLSNRETLVFNIVNLQVVYDKLAGNQIAAPLMFWDGNIITKYQQNETNVIRVHNQGNGTLHIVQTQTEHIRRLRMDYRRHMCGGYFKLTSWEIQLKQPAVTNINYGPIMCVWTLMQDSSWSTAQKFQISGNFSFTDSCDLEYISIRHGQSLDSERSIKICRDNREQLKNYDLRSDYTHVIYQSRNFNYQSSKLSMTVEPTVACGSEVQVLQKSSFLEIYQEAYQNNQNCIWTFYTAPGLQMLFQFLGIGFIEESINCTKDYLEFQRFEEGIWIADVRFCGRNSLQTYNATSTRMRVVWRTNEAITGYGFALHIRSHCSLTLNVTSAIQRIESPAAGFDENPKLHCDYTFLANDPEKMINVKTKFNGVCAKDNFYVTALDANGIESTEAHCESELEFKAYKYMRLNFNVYEVGYYTIEYVLDTCCGGKITTSGSFIRPLRQDLKDLNGNNMDCVWYVTAPADYSIAVRFKYFHTADDEGYVSIYAGSKLEDAKLLRILSGNLTHNAPVIMIDHNRAIISAVSNYFLAARGFEAEIVFMHNCNERISLINATSTLTLARNYKLRAAEEYMCTYRVTAPKGHRIGIEIRKLQINNAPCTVAKESCKKTCNAIEIFDSLATKQASMDTFCTSSTATSSCLMSSYEDTILTFTANQPGELKFEIVFTMQKSTCGQLKNNEADGSKAFEFTFPTNGEESYSPNIHCTWRLPLDHWMEIDFDYMDLQNTSQVTGRCLDYIEIKEGVVSTKYCGQVANFTSNVLRTYRSNDYADITFHSDASVEGKGFKFVVHRAMTCNRTYHQASGVIDFTREETVCSNTIAVPDSLILNIYVTDMINGRSECPKRQNKIIDKRTNHVLFDLCKIPDVTKTNVFNTNTNAVRLDFMDYATVSYSTAPRNATPGCGGTWTSGRGVFASPYYENDLNFSECRWDIIVPAPNIIQLEFDGFAMGTTTNCTLDNVQVFDIYPDGSAILLGTLCGSDQPAEIISASNHVTVVSKTSPNFNGVGWSLKYEVLRFDMDERDEK